MNPRLTEHQERRLQKYLKQRPQSDITWQARARANVAVYGLVALIAVFALAFTAVGYRAGAHPVLFPLAILGWAILGIACATLTARSITAPRRLSDDRQKRLATAILLQPDAGMTISPVVSDFHDLRIADWRAFVRILTIPARPKTPDEIQAEIRGGAGQPSPSGAVSAVREKSAQSANELPSTRPSSEENRP